jgi:tetratricopeptide (TPR) repeat protein
MFAENTGYVRRIEGLDLYRLGRYREALAEFYVSRRYYRVAHMSTSGDRGDAEIIASLFHQRLYTQALREGKAYRPPPSLDPDTNNALGVVLCAVGRIHEASVRFESAVAKDPSQAVYHYNLANVYKQLGMPSGARAEATRAQQLSAGKSREWNGMIVLADEARYWEEERGPAVQKGGSVLR